MENYDDEYNLLEEDEDSFDFEYVDDYSQNAPCDNTGICASASCPYFWKCCE